MTSVAIVTPWLDHADLWPAYRQVIAERRLGDEVLIVDNASDPPLDFATVRLGENRGFCGGSNVGLRLATTDAVVFLNNDVELTEAGWLDTLRAVLEPGVLVGPQLRNDPHTRVNGRHVPYLDGWCVAGMRADLVEIGGWDDTLTEPAYFSDNLLCLEARAAGMTFVETKVGLRHLGNTTARGVPAKTREATIANRGRYAERAADLFATDQRREHAWASS